MNTTIKSNPNVDFEALVKEEWTAPSTISAWREWAEKLAIHTQPLTDALIEHANLEAGLSVLDLASGTGEPALSIAGIISESGSVTATDLSNDMLDIAKDLAKQKNISNMAFRLADAHDLPFKDNQYDRVVSRLGLMYFWDVGTAIKEIIRVTKPGGRVSFVVWGAPEKNEFLSGLIAPFMKYKEMPAPPEDAPTPMRFGHVDKLIGYFSAAGFNEINTHEYVEVLPWPGSPKELFKHVYDVAVPLQPYFDSFDEQTKQKALNEIESSFGSFWDGEFTRALGAFNVVSAIKPN